MEILVPMIPSTSTYYYSRPHYPSSRYGWRQKHSALNHFLNNVRPASNEDWLTPCDILQFMLGPSENENPKDNDTNKSDAGKEQGSSGSGENAIAKNNLFEVKVNVNAYKPDELNVKIADGMVTIEGSHEESKINKADSNNNIHDEQFISRRFSRSFKLPENIMEDKIECQLSSDGQLIVTAPLKAIEPLAPENLRTIPISIVNSETDDKSQAIAMNSDTDVPENKNVDTTGSESNEVAMDTANDN